MKNLRDRGRGRRSIKARLTAVVLFSNIALLAMWAVVSLPSLYDAIYLRAVNTTAAQVTTPSVESLTSVQEERRLSMLYLSQGGASLQDLDAQRRKGDQWVDEVRRIVQPVLGLSPDSVQQKWAEFEEAYHERAKVRAQIDARQIDLYQAYEFFNKCNEAGLGLFDAMARFEPDQEASYSATASVELFRTNELMSRASTLVDHAFATGGLGTADHATFAHLIGAYHQQLVTTVAHVTDDTKAAYRTLTGSDQWKKLVAAEDKLIGTGTWSTAPPGRRGQDQAAPPLAQPDWAGPASTVAKDLNQLGRTQVVGVVELGISKANSALFKAILGSVVALLAAIAAMIAATRVTRMISRRLNGLRDETLELADKRLPEIVGQLRAGEKVDVATQLPTLDYGEDEIGQVAAAFNTAQATAVRAAVQESQAKEGVNTVFLGIAHRSQALVHRQLKILDQLEREQEDAQQLDALFRLDHLATRARRNAENLIILGGGQPGRKWRNPVLLVDVLRSAAAEIEHYARVRTQGIPRVWLAGGAVTDMVHLVSELLDNATSFSPPRAQVRLSAEPAAKGVVIEVEDNGLGMSEEDRVRHNAMLADPPEFDAMALRGDSRLGLFVVARLAGKHGIRVELRSSSYGGTRAIVLVPSGLLTEEGDQREDAEPQTALMPLADPVPSLAEESAEGMAWPEEGAPADEAVPGFSLFPAGSADRGRSPVPAGSSTSELDDFWADSVAASVAEESRNASSASMPRPFPATPSADPPAFDPSAFDPSAFDTSGDDPLPRRRRRAMDVPASQPAWPADEPVDGEPVPPRADRHAEPADQDVPPPLPRRRRQANLAPQLREAAAYTPETDDAGDVVDGRSPEEIRDMMSSFQHNSYRARHAEGSEER